MKAVCDHCRHLTDNTRKSYRLDRNLQPHYLRLCTPCRPLLGYTAVDYFRTPLELATNRGGDR